MKMLSGLAAAVLGVLTFFCLFGMWSAISGLNLSGVTWGAEGLFGIEDAHAKVNIASVFGLLTFIAGLLLAIVFVLEFLNVIKERNARNVVFALAGLLFVFALLTLIFGLVAVNEYKIGDTMTLKIGYGGWIAIITGMLGGIAGCYYGTKLSKR